MKDILGNKKATSFISFLMGFMFLYFSTVIDSQDIWQQILVAISQAFFVAIPVTFFTSWLSDTSMKEIIGSLLPICNKSQQYGVIDILDSFPVEKTEFRNEFIYSKQFFLVMNDGKQFLSNNAELFDERLKENNEINIILLDYNDEALMKMLTAKNKHEGDYYKDKIKNVITYHLNKNGIQVYLNSFYNTMAMLVTDNYAIISLYREALGKGKVPHFVFKNNGNNSEYKRILDDVRELCKRSEKINGVIKGEKEQ